MTKDGLAASNYARQLEEKIKDDITQDPDKKLEINYELIVLFLRATRSKFLKK